MRSKVYYEIIVPAGNSNVTESKLILWETIVIAELYKEI